MLWVHGAARIVVYSAGMRQMAKLWRSKPPLKPPKRVLWVLCDRGKQFGTSSNKQAGLCTISNNLYSTPTIIQTIYTNSYNNDGNEPRELPEE